MTWSIKYLPHIHEDLCSAPTTQIKGQTWQCTPVIVVLGWRRVRKEDPILAKQVSFRLSEDPVSIK